MKNQYTTGFSTSSCSLDVVDKKITRALKSTRSKRLAVGGGVINNQVLRRRIEESSQKEGIELYMPQKQHCADNAAMIAVLGEALFKTGEESDLFLNAEPAIY